MRGAGNRAELKLGRVADDARECVERGGGGAVFVHQTVECGRANPAGADQAEPVKPVVLVRLGLRNFQAGLVGHPVKVPPVG